VKTRPTILCVTQAYTAGDSKSSLQVDEILIVKKLSKTHVMKKRVLKVYSLTTKEYKTLQVRAFLVCTSVHTSLGSGMTERESLNVR